MKLNIYLQIIVVLSIFILFSCKTSLVNKPTPFGGSWADKKQPNKHILSNTCNPGKANPAGTNSNSPNLLFSITKIINSHCFKNTGGSSNQIYLLKHKNHRQLISLRPAKDSANTPKKPLHKQSVTAFALLSGSFACALIGSMFIIATIFVIPGPIVAAIMVFLFLSAIVLFIIGAIKTFIALSDLKAEPGKYRGKSFAVASLIMLLLEVIAVPIAYIGLTF